MNESQVSLSLRLATARVSYQVADAADVIDIGLDIADQKYRSAAIKGAFFAVSWFVGGVINMSDVKIYNKVIVGGSLDLELDY